MTEPFDTWERKDFLSTVANYLVDNGGEVSDLVDLIEKPWHYVAEYRAAKAIETEDVEVVEA